MEISHLTQTTVRQFILFTKFLAEHNLWDEAEKHLESHGCTEIMVSGEPIVALRQMIHQKASAGAHFATPMAMKQARVIADCGCGVSNPGPPGGPPKSPEPPPGPPDGGGDGGGDGGDF